VSDLVSAINWHSPHTFWKMYMAPMEPLTCQLHFQRQLRCRWLNLSSPSPRPYQLPFQSQLRCRWLNLSSPSPRPYQLHFREQLQCQRLDLLSQYPALGQ
ncbi:unnamed protein product, partial [Meganyctiphanes norvegica]